MTGQTKHVTDATAFEDAFWGAVFLIDQASIKLRQAHGLTDGNDPFLIGLMAKMDKALSELQESRKVAWVNEALDEARRVAA
jgi:hypothetical protein